MLVGPSVPGVGASARQARVLIVVAISGAADQPALDTLVAGSIAVDLQGFDVAASVAEKPAADESEAAALAVEAGADYAVFVNSSRNGTSIHVDAAWLDTATRTRTSREAADGELNLSFDAVISQLVAKLVEEEQPRLALLPPETAASPEPTLGAAAPLESTPPEVDLVSELPTAAPVQQAAALEPRLARFALRGGAAPFIATFSALNYFPVGLSLWLSGNGQARLPDGYGAYGLGTGVTAFHGRGAYTQADFYLVPIGVDLRYGTTTGGPADFAVHAQAGPAVFIAHLDTGELLAKVVPYLTAGVGIAVTLFDVVGISLDGSYTCYFDAPEPILGFTPTVSIVIKL
jgi:hypothetical protein